MKAYLASHFFSESGYDWSVKLAKSIRQAVPSIDLYNPLENEEINDKKNNDDEITAEKIADGDNYYLERANILIANLDGVEIDSGVSAEIGYFSGLIKVEESIITTEPRFIIGIYTDIRQDGTGDNHYYINLYTKGLVEKNGVIVRNVSEVVEIINKIQKQIENEVGE